MNSHNLPPRLSLLMVIALLLSGCNVSLPAPLPTPNPTATLIPTSTLTPVPTFTPTPMPTRIHTPTPMPTLTPTSALTATQALRLTPTASPESIVYDGDWSGITDQGKRISFKVVNNAITSLRVEYAQSICPLTYISLESFRISGNSFTATSKFPSLTITGTFSSRDNVSGTLQADKSPCGEPITVKWNANKVK